MKKINLFLMLTLLGFGIMTQTAQAQMTTAPDLSLQTTAGTGANALGAAHNARIAIAPYAQVTPNSTYTFIGVSHPSLDTAHTSIGVAVEAIDMTTVPNNAAGRAAVFTVHAGETHRVFIVNQSHSTINSSNSDFVNSKTHIITTTDASQFGNIKVTGIGTSPTAVTDVDERYQAGAYNDSTTSGTGATNVQRYDNVSQLAMWGVVYQSSNGAGFALEFIGDMHDSSNGTAEEGASADGLFAKHTKKTGQGRGVN